MILRSGEAPGLEPAWTAAEEGAWTQGSGLKGSGVFARYRIVGVAAAGLVEGPVGGGVVYRDRVYPLGGRVVIDPGTGAGELLWDRPTVATINSPSELLLGVPGGRLKRPDGCYALVPERLAASG